MKKFLVSLAAVAALAIVPISALGAVGTWGGWSDEHSDNAAAPSYWVSTSPPGPGTFTNNGSGDSRYCLNPSSTDPKDCSGGVSSPVVVTGFLVAGGQSVGCNHSASGCPAGDSIGGFFVGTAPGGTGVGLQG